VEHHIPSRITPGTCGFKSVGKGGGSNSLLEASSCSKRSPAGCNGQVYNRDDLTLQLSSGLIDLRTSGGGDQGESAEDSTHPKPPAQSIHQGRVVHRITMQPSRDVGGSSAAAGGGMAPEDRRLKEHQKI
jgi:hypothetical protein